MKSNPLQTAILLATFGPFMMPWLMWRMAVGPMTRSNICRPK